MFFSLWLYLFNHWVLNFRLDLCQRVPHSRTVWIHALDIHRDWWNFFCFFSFWTPRSWFSVESIRKPCRRIGTWATLVAGSATSRWLGSATSCATSIPTASNATRPSSPTRATIATASSVSTPRYVRHSEGSNSSLSYTIANRRRKLLVGHMSQPKTRTYYSDRLFFSFFMVHLGFVVQGSPLARGLFLVQQVPVVAGRQAIRLQGWQDFLRPVLRLYVRDSVRRMRRNLPRRYIVPLSIWCLISERTYREDRRNAYSIVWSIAIYCEIRTDGLFDVPQFGTRSACNGNTTSRRERSAY